MPDPFEVSGIGSKPQAIGTDPRQLRTSAPAPGGDTKSFKEVLADAVGEVQRLQNEADTTIQKVVAGEIQDVTGAMVEIEKADVAFQTMMVVRNKIVAAYEEIMRMQV